MPVEVLTKDESCATMPSIVMVTGSTGFVGRHLVKRLLADGVAVWGIDRRPSGFHHPSYTERVVDLLDRDLLCGTVQEAAPGGLVHLAARTDLDETRNLAGYAANTVGVEHLLAAIEATPSIRRWICTSSQLVCRVGYQPLHDEDYQPSTLYGESKVRTEQIVRAAAGAGREWCLTRPTTIWGPGMNSHYQTFFRLIRDGRYWHVGQGPTLKSYGYVGNTVLQYKRLLEAPAWTTQGRVLYLADYEPLALEAWAEAFRGELGAPPIRTLPSGLARAAARMGDVINALGAKRFPFNSFRLNNVQTSYRVDLSLTKTVCGDLPYDMAEGVWETAQWLRAMWDAKPNE